jgi:hypothetical protein
MTMLDEIAALVSLARNDGARGAPKYPVIARSVATRQSRIKRRSVASLPLRRQGWQSRVEGEGITAR